MEFTLVVIVII